ncbi:hypothetical protein BTW00_04895 [Psychrobacter sp. C 20.9]|nr:hypothetical protein BTW00_04895 [Psychrobacter sp. C 20.9]
MFEFLFLFHRLNLLILLATTLNKANNPFTSMYTSISIMVAKARLVVNVAHTLVVFIMEVLHAKEA